MKERKMKEKYENNFSPLSKNNFFPFYQRHK